MTWQPKLFRIIRSGPQGTLPDDVGGFVLLVGGDFVYGVHEHNPGVWHVTHLRTGCTFKGAQYSSQRKAQRVAERLAFEVPELSKVELPARAQRFAAEVKQILAEEKET